MLAAVVAGRRWEGQRDRVQPGGSPTQSGSRPLAGGQSGAPSVFPSVCVCVCMSPFFSASPSSIPSLYVPVSLSPLTSPQFSLAASLSPVATVNDLACRGLDKLGEKLPFLQQPSETVPSTTRWWGSCRGWRWQRETQPEHLGQLDSRTQSGFGQLEQNSHQMKIIDTRVY